MCPWPIASCGEIVGIWAASAGPLSKAGDLLRLTAQRSREGHLSVPAQLAEMLWLKLYRGIGPGYYHAAGFWRRDISWRSKSHHIGEREYQRRLVHLNAEAYRKLVAEL